jgi:hypothetical protein
MAPVLVAGIVHLVHEKRRRFRSILGGLFLGENAALRKPRIMRKNSYGELPMTMLLPVRSIFRAVVSTVVPEAKNLGEPGWSELETLVETTLQNRSRAMHRQLRLFIRTIQWMPVLRYGRRHFPQRRTTGAGSLLSAGPSSRSCPLRILGTANPGPSGLLRKT